MKKVAAIIVATAILAPASPALASTTHHSTAKARCTKVARGHHPKRHVRVCKVTHKKVTHKRAKSHKKARRHAPRAHSAVIKPPKATTHQSTTPATPRPHYMPPSAPVHCDLYASPSGSDSTGDGSLGNPYAGVVKLDRALSPGQTGCLRGGVYGSISTWFSIDNSGTAAGRVTLTAYPGESPTIKGWVVISASYTTLSHLQIDGSNNFYTKQRSGTSCPYPVSEGLSIEGANNILEYDNYYQSVASLRGNGIGIGWSGTPDNTVIRYTKIHDVGQCQDYDHLIYLSHGNNVQIYDNWLWNDHNGWGVQLYPDPSNARVWGNVIDNTGAGFTIGDEQGDNVSGNQIFNNVVMNSVGLPTASIGAVAISDYWGGPRGTGNTFTNNVSFNNSGGVSRVSNVAISSTSTGNPKFVDSFSHNYTLQAGSPVSAWSMWSGNTA